MENTKYETIENQELSEYYQQGIDWFKNWEESENQKIINGDSSLEKHQKIDNEKLMKMFGSLELSADEIKALNYLSIFLPSNIDNIISIVNKKVKSKSAGRKVKVDLSAIRIFKKEGKTQEWIARQMDVSISTIRRHWNCER